MKAQLNLPISFSLPEMRPFVETGIRAIEKGLPATRLMTPLGRVKRQTLRAVGRKPDLDPYGRAQRAGEAGRPVRLRLWWKIRTAERALLGDVPLARVARIALRPDGAGLRLEGGDLPAPDVFAKYDGFEDAAEMRQFFFDGEHADKRMRALWWIQW